MGRLDDDWIRAALGFQTMWGFPVKPIMWGHLPKVVSVSVRAYESRNVHVFRRILSNFNWLSAGFGIADISDLELAKRLMPS